jgi:hypothetical protein
VKAESIQSTYAHVKRPLRLSCNSAQLISTFLPQAIFRGLRVRMGMHCGISDPQDVHMDLISGHTTYSGLNHPFIGCLGKASFSTLC